jgi:starvation-inducible outer membrane lipoprotein
MRIIGLLTMSVWLSACSTGPMFPPAIMRDVEANTFDAKAWEDQAYHPSSVTFVPHKVELAGEIVRVIQRSDHLVILAEEKPLEAHPTSSPPSIEPDSAPWYAITFKGAVEPRLLQAGNRLIAVGTTNPAGAEMLGGAPRVLPHLMAQCLHIWDTEGARNKYFFSGTGFVEPYPPAERTFCLEGGNADSLPSGSSVKNKLSLTIQHQ